MLDFLSLSSAKAMTEFFNEGVKDREKPARAPEELVQITPRKANPIRRLFRACLRVIAKTKEYWLSPE